jgi:hypothetical protein
MASEQPEIQPTLPFKFGINDVVEHVKSGGHYVIAGLPNEYVIEATREPAYAYRMADGRVCVRCQSEFEDGRFEYRGHAHELGYPREIARGIQTRE